MKVKILLLFIALTIFSGTADILAQKKHPRVASGKNLHNTLSALLRNAKEIPAKNPKCDPKKLLKSIPKNKLLPSPKELTDMISTIVDDSLSPTYGFGKYNSAEILELLSNTKTKSEFIGKLDFNYGDMKKKDKDRFDQFYYASRRGQKTGFKIFESSFKQRGCDVKVETTLKVTRFKAFQTARFTPSKAQVDWFVLTSVSINCPCTKSNKHKVKTAKYEYEATTSGPMLFDRQKYGLRFGKLEKPKYHLKYLDCCDKFDDPVEDGSFVDPNEDINNKNTLLDTGLAIGFGGEVETNLGFSGGVLFNVAEIGGNPLFVGSKATVSTTSITNEDVKELRVLVGPTAEYQIPLNDGRTRIVTGVNSGYTFGNVESFGFDQDFSGITVNTYAGAQFNVGNNLAITALLNFLEFSSLTFKSDMENFEATTSNTTFLTDGGAISVGVRIGLD